MVPLEKFDKTRDHLGIRCERRRARNILGDRCGRTGQAQQALEFKPADAVKTVAQRILYRPGRRAIPLGGSLMQAQIFTQRHRQGGSAHQPVHSRKLANGRRKT